uniref:Uncharacterized protein n=1 Tax=Arundo donax TaxID=35708 RepID=A0A0A9CBI9_ARUDO
MKNGLHFPNTVNDRILQGFTMFSNSFRLPFHLSVIATWRILPWVFKPQPSSSLKIRFSSTDFKVLISWMRSLTLQELITFVLPIDSTNGSIKVFSMSSMK